MIMEIAIIVFLNTGDECQSICNGNTINITGIAKCCGWRYCSW